MLLVSATFTSNSAVGFSNFAGGGGSGRTGCGAGVGGCSCDCACVCGCTCVRSCGSVPLGEELHEHKTARAITLSAAINILCLFNI